MRPDTVHLWLPRGDEYELAASLGLCEKDRELQEQLVSAVQEQVARDLPGVPVRVHRYHVWRVVRMLAKLKVTNTPDGRASAIAMLAHDGDSENG